MTRRRAAWIAVAVVVTLAIVLPLTLISSGPALPALPPTARQVAQQIGATGFTECGKALLYSTDSGTAYIGREKIGINTFGNQKARDAWLNDAEPLGVTAFRESSTWVAYVALSQSAGCS
jgi:hypothetical protein